MSVSGHKKSSSKPKALPCGRVLKPDNPPPSQEQMLVWQQALKKHLSAKSLKYTEQRWAIAELILQGSGHMDAPTLVRRVKKIYPKMGAATVYRNIKVLCEAGILKESYQDTEGKAVYEIHNEDHHDHIICLDCGEIFEFHDTIIEGHQEKVSNSMHFKLAGHRHVIHGHCDYLVKKKQQK